MTDNEEITEEMVNEAMMNIAREAFSYVSFAMVRNGWAISPRGSDEEQRLLMAILKYVKDCENMERPVKAAPPGSLKPV